MSWNTVEEANKEYIVINDGSDTNQIVSGKGAVKVVVQDALDDGYGLYDITVYELGKEVSLDIKTEVTIG